MLKLRARASDVKARVAGVVNGWLQACVVGQQLRQLISAIDRHDTFRAANAMAFDLFFAVIPMLGLAGYTASRVLSSRPEALVEGSRLLDLAPTQFHGFIVRNVTAFADAELAPLFVLSGLWLSSSAFLTMIRTFEETFDTEPRSWLKARLLALGLAAAALVMFVIATGVGAFFTWQRAVSKTYGTRAAETLQASPAFVLDLEPLGLLAFAGSTLGIVGFLALVYRVAVVGTAKRRRFFPGASAATLAGLFGSFVLAYYAGNLSNYTLFYGSLAIVVVVLLWLWLWCSAILIGAEVNVVLEGTGGAAAQGAGAEPVGPTHTPSVVGNPDGD